LGATSAEVTIQPATFTPKNRAAGSPKEAVPTPAPQLERAPDAEPGPAPRPEAVEALSGAIGALRLIGAKLAEQARSDALEIAFQIARRILEAELAASPQPLFALVRTAVKRVGEAREVTLRLNPLDAAMVEEEPREKLGLSLATVNIVADPALSRGDCVVESELGSVDGRLSGRLDELRRSLSEAIAGSAA
jgi:flagellar assembly protein FliH